MFSTRGLARRFGHLQLSAGRTTHSLFPLLLHQTPSVLFGENGLFSSTKRLLGPLTLKLGGFLSQEPISPVTTPTTSSSPASTSCSSGTPEWRCRASSSWGK